jgi:hypothetical protein
MRGCRPKGLERDDRRFDLLGHERDPPDEWREEHPHDRATEVSDNGPAVGIDADSLEVHPAQLLPESFVRSELLRQAPAFLVSALRPKTHSLHLHDAASAC